MTDYKKERYVYPDGIYGMEIVGTAITEGKAKDDGTPGNPYLVVNAKVLEFKKNKAGTKPTVKTGLNRPVNMYFTEKTIEQTKDFLVAAGFNGKSLMQLDPNHPQFINLAGYKFDAVNRPEKSSKGDLWDKFSALRGNSDPNAWMGKLPSASSTKMMQLDAVFNSTATTSKPVAPAKPAATQAATTTKSDADETAADVPWTPEGDFDDWN